MNRHNLKISVLILLLPLIGLSQSASLSLQIHYITTWTFSQSDSLSLSEPSSLSVSPDGSLFIADTDNNRIIKLNVNGRFVKQMGGFGWEKEQFNSPVAVSAENGLDVFVADYYNNRIERYDKDLHYLASFSSGESWPDDLAFGFPLDVGISSQGELFCLDGENQRVLKLDVLGNPQISFGDYDSGEGWISQPGHLTVSRYERIFVTDEDKAEIIAFDLHGNFLFTFGRGIFQKPAGMTEYGTDLFIIADSGRKQVMILYKYLKLINEISGSSENGFLFKEPVDVAVWKDRLYVLDRKRDAVDVFRLIFLKPAGVW